MSILDISTKRAKECLEHLLYEIPEKTMHNIAARLAQEQGVSVETFGTARGHWKWPVVTRLLSNRGFKCTVATEGQRWLLDSPSFLGSAPGFVGFIDKDTLMSYTYSRGVWNSRVGALSLKEVYKALQLGNTVAVHQMWATVAPFYAKEKAFHITTDDAPWTRHECQPTSCWRSEPVSYKDREVAVKLYLRAHRKSTIMMSNSQEMVLCSPGPSGWATETIMNYECMTIKETSQQVAELLADKLVRRIEQRNTGWSTMAHALFHALQRLGGSLKSEECSVLSTAELAILEEYENGMYK